MPLFCTLVAACLFVAPGCSKHESKAEPAQSRERGDEMKPSKRVAMIVAFEGFQHLEYSVPRQALEQAGYVIDVVSSKKGMALGTGDMKAEVSMTLEELLPALDSYAAIVFVGGPGSPEFHANPVAHQLARQAAEKQKVLAAICLAPFTLARAGVLKGVKATAWTDDEAFSPKVFREFGPIYTADPVVVDGKILTANGPAAAAQFAARLLELLSK